MRFMLMIKSDASAEAGLMPSLELVGAMDKYNDELRKAGALLSAEGLKPSAKGARLTRSGKKTTVVDGPFAEAKEIIAGYWMIRAASKEEAVQWALRVPLEAGTTYDNANKPCDIEVREIFEVDDFPKSENESGWREEEEKWRAEHDGQLAARKPAAGAMRFMLMIKGNDASERGEMPKEETLAAMGALVGELLERGKLMGGEGLKPSSKGAVVTYLNGKRTVKDGPFPEAKELIGGFSIVEAASKAEALEIAERHLEIHGDGDAELRELYSMSEMPPELIAKMSADAAALAGGTP